MTKQQRTFVKGAAILAFAGLIVKGLGAVFRIPLTNIISADGMANYSVAYVIYAFLVVISTAGIPVAISKMVSERVTVGDYRGAHKVFQAAFKMLIVIGIVSTALILALSGVIADSINIPTARYSLMAIAPSLFFVSLLSAYRGYFQGLQQMIPTAGSQLVEQVIKVSAGLLLAYLLVPYGVEYGAAGALIGVSLSEICALVLLIILYNRMKASIKELRRNSPASPYQGRFDSIRKELVVIALPIILGAVIMPVVMLLDSWIINNIMPTVDYLAYNPLDAQASYGVMTGAVNPLINMPAVLSLSLCMSLVPAISEAKSTGNDIEASERSAMGFKLAVLVGLPCALGMFLLAKPIIALLFSAGLSNQEINLAAELLQILAVGVLFLTMLQTVTGILQGAGKPYIPMLSLFAGAIVKVVLSIVLIRVPELNINGAAIGTAACYGIAALINFFAMLKVVKPKIRLVSGILMPVVSTAAMGAAVYLLANPLQNSLGDKTSTLVLILIAVLVYVVMIFLTGALKKDDMEYIPGGGLMIRLMTKIGFWRD